MRACAALGVVATHVALQTGLTHGLTGGLLIRLDLAVAVFFALSGFLLWRSHAGAAHGFRSVPRAAPYLRSRLVRIMPAYLLTVVVVLTLLPDARTAGRSVWIANLTLDPGVRTQNAVRGPEPDVEPLGRDELLSGSAAAGRGGGAAAGAGPGTGDRRGRAGKFRLGYLPIPTSNGANPLNWAPAYAAWFAVGMLLAEWTCRPMSWLHRMARRRVLMTSIALAAYLVAASPLVVPPAYRHAMADQFIIRTVLGVIIAGCLLAPLILDQPQARHRMLGSTSMAALGRWSYGLFLWHLAALDTALAILNRPASTGGFPVVFVVTVVFGSAIAAVSYALIEEPCRLALRRWEIRRQMDGGSSALPVQERFHRVAGVSSSTMGSRLARLRAEETRTHGDHADDQPATVECAGRSRLQAAQFNALGAGRSRVRVGSPLKITHSQRSYMLLLTRVGSLSFGQVGAHPIVDVVTLCGCRR